MDGDLQITEAIVIPAAELEWSAVRASGPGGQNVNKVSTKIDLRFELQQSEALSDAVKARLRALPEVRLDAQGRVVITSQAARSQAANLEDARDKLAGLIRRALHVPKRRKRTRPSRAARRRRLEAKRRKGEKKQGRGKIRG